jgi:hypothetical protein
MTTLSKPISKILVAIDGSDKSTEASQYAISLAKKNSAKLFALNVINTQPWFYSSTPYGWATPEKMENVHKRDREEALSVTNTTSPNSMMFDDNFDFSRDYINQFGRLIPYDFVNQVIPVIFKITGEEWLDAVTLPTHI